MIMKRPSKPIAQFVLESLEQENNKKTNHVIDLYPEKSLNESTNEFLNEMKRKADIAAQKNRRNAFRESVKNRLIFHCLYEGVLEPVLNEQYANSHEKELARNTVNKFIQEETTDKLLSNFRYRGYYLAEFAYNVNNMFNTITEAADKKIKEGLSEKDAYSIEDESINKFVLDTKSIIPKDITKKIRDRVQDSITDFIDENKKNKSEIKKIYDKARTKIANTNSVELQQEALNSAKRQEKVILESNSNLFGAMAKIMLESVHKVKVLKEAYTGSNNKIDFKKVIDDTKVMYSFLECINTLSIIDINESYINTMLNDMKKSIDEVASSTNSISTMIKDDNKNKDVNGDGDTNDSVDDLEKTTLTNIIDGSTNKK